MALTGTMLKKACSAVAGGASGSKVDSWDNMASSLDQAMKDIGLRNRQACATYLATVVVETAWLRTFTEYLGKPGTAAWRNQQRYAPYYGRGAIQTTWREGYEAMGAFAKKRGLISDAAYFVKNPTKLADPKYAWLTGVEYYLRARSGKAWTINGHLYKTLAELANANASISVISKAVNRGNPSAKSDAYGIDERTKVYKAFYALGDAIVPSGGSKPTTPEVPTMPAGPQAAKDNPLHIALPKEARVAFQRMLVRHGYKIKIDGMFGPGTTEAAQDFFGTSKDGRVDDPSSLVAAIQGSLQWFGGTRTDGKIDRQFVAVLTFYLVYSNGNFHD